MDNKIDRSAEIHSKGFDLYGNNKFSLQDLDGPLDYRKIKVGVKNLDDATLNLGNYKGGCGFGGINKGIVFRALATHDLPELRRISNLFYNTNGLY